MMTSWFSFFRRRRIQPTLTAIYVATGAGEPMQALTCVEAVSGSGLQGDRYCTGTGHWLSIEACQVTLITAHDLQQAVKNTTTHIQKELDTGGHRRNLVIDGLKTRELEGRSFGIGSAVFRYDKPRPPCGYIDQVAGKGMGRALSHNSGICIRVVSGGVLTVGDAVVILDNK